MFNDIDIYNKYLKNKIVKRLNKSIDENNFIFGKSVSDLEKSLSNYTKSKYVISVGSGTDALLLSLLSLNLKKSDEIIIPSFSWLSVVEVVLLLNLKPIFVDTDSKNFNLNINSIKNLITKKTRAVITTSLFGRTCELDLLKKILPKNILHIEDGAQNFGSIYKGKNSLNFADISCTSFFPTKNLGSFGDGGAVFTNKKNIYKKILMLRNHGQNKYSSTTLTPGINSRIGSLQASVLIEKLKKINFKLKKQTIIYKKYQNFFDKNKITGFPEFRNTKNIKDTYSSFNLILKKRSKFLKMLKNYKVPFKIYYPKPLYRQYNLRKSLYYNTEFICNSIVSLPYNDLSNKRFNQVLKNLQKIINNDRKIFFEKET